MVHLFSCLLPCSVFIVDAASWGSDALSEPLGEQSIISAAHVPARFLATLMRLSRPWNTGVYLHTARLGTLASAAKWCYTSPVKVSSIIFSSAFLFFVVIEGTLASDVLTFSSGLCADSAASLKRKLDPVFLFILCFCCLMFWWNRGSRFILATKPFILIKYLLGCLYFEISVPAASCSVCGESGQKKRIFQGLFREKKWDAIFSIFVWQKLQGKGKYLCLVVLVWRRRTAWE